MKQGKQGGSPGIAIINAYNIKCLIFLFKLVMIRYMHVKKAIDVDLEYFRSFGIYSSRIHFMNVTLLFYHCVLKLGKSSSI